MGRATGFQDHAIATRLLGTCGPQGSPFALSRRLTNGSWFDEKKPNVGMHRGMS